MKKSLKFPENFYWGAATASYQVEGGIENNDWARAAREGKVPPAGRSTDHYNKYEEDFNLAKSLGQNAQRISIEWSRIEPEEGKFDQKEIEHYRDVLQAMIRRGLKPFVTLWHFTVPEWFLEKGGFEKKESSKIFARYCEFVTKELDDLCKDWATMNEPMVYILNGYIDGRWPPFKRRNFLKSEKVFYNLVKSHNLAYKKIRNVTKESRISFVTNNVYVTTNWWPWNLIAKIFHNWYWNHRFLVLTTPYSDAIGLNYYFYNHLGKDKGFPKSDFGWNLNPEGIYHVLMELKIYNKPIYIAEAGLADKEDKYRSGYIKGLIYWLYQAIKEGLDIRGFMYWSLLDNYEWDQGYTQHFGLAEIDSNTKKRKLRKSAFVYKKICDDNALTLE